MSSKTGKNAIANLFSSLSGPLIGLVMTPFYLHKIGLEGLGLVGLMTLISTTLGVFVAGISKTYQRDIATAQAVAPEDLAGLVKGGLLLFALIGLILGSVVVLFGHGEIRHLSKGTRFTPEMLDHCLLLIGALLAFGVTSGGIGTTLITFRDQLWPTAVGITVNLAVAAASWLALTRWPRVDVFYLCQFAGAVVTFTCLSIRCFQILGRSSQGVRSRGIRDAWKEKLRTSGRLSLILILHEGLGILIGQIDRLLVTSQFPLASLGAYNLGANPSRLVGIFTGPIITVTYPDFCKIAADGSGRKVIGEYLARITFLLVLLLGAAMIVIVPAANDLLVIWLGAANVPPQAAACFVLLSLGHLLLAIAGPSYNLTVAFGKVGYGIPKNIVSLLVLPPLGLLTAKFWGLPGVAVIWVVYATNCILVCGWFAYRRHADFHSGSRWSIAGLVSLMAAGGIAYSLAISGLEGWWMIVASVVCSAIFLLAFVISYFGAKPKSWFHALELTTPSASSIGDQSLAGTLS